MALKGTDQSLQGMVQTPGGQIFGIENWIWRDPIPTTLTFFTDGTLFCGDQYGRAILRAVTNDGKEVLFAPSAPDIEDAPQGTNTAPGFRRAGRPPAQYSSMQPLQSVSPRPPARYCTHLEGVLALEAEGIDWKQCTMAGWPWLPLAMLRELAILGKLPPVDISQLHHIKTESLRKDALRVYLEMSARRDEQRARELLQAERELAEAMEAAKAAAENGATAIHGASHETHQIAQATTPTIESAADGSERRDGPIPKQASTTAGAGVRNPKK